MKKLLTLLAALALMTFGLAACGSDDDSGSSTTAESSAPADTGDTAATGSGETVDVTADPNGDLAWTETKIDAAAGPATVELVNNSPTTHDLVVEDSDGNGIGEAEDVANGTTSFDTDLKPGTYTYYCSLPGHREAGMEGTLTVK